ncbi:13336_t:CDS:2, partial [Funneliformis geosporum]
PWDRVDGSVLPYPNIPKHKPLGGNFYPEDMTKDEFNLWLKKLSSKEQKDANGFYHVIKRNEDTGELFLNPYSNEYKDLLGDASNLLKESSRLVEDDSLSKFLKSRADAFSSNNYFESEVDWLNISKKSKIEVTVGPYEVYISAKNVENHLPVPDEYKNKKLKATPIVVVNQLYASGDVAVPMTAAYNLPND